MAVKGFEDIMTTLKSFVGDRTDDEAMSFIEDVSDTFSDMETRLSSNESELWKRKYTENDTAWRKKYTDRFFGKPDTDIEVKEPEEKEYKTFEDLF